MRLNSSCVLFGGFAWAGAFAIVGCSHGPVKETKEGSDPRALLAAACSTGAQVVAAKGSVWLKAQSKEASGQFPAVVSAPSPDRLKMEVTNLVGGTEAIISVEGSRYSIEVPNHKERDERGEASWGGIPLQWANALFLGRVPCPDPSVAMEADVTMGAEGEVIVQTKAALDRVPERYAFRLRQLEGSQWPESLRWERQGPGSAAPIAVDFKFEDPEPKTRSPRKWEAKGAQGEVKVRWRDRQIEMTR